MLDTNEKLKLRLEIGYMEDGANELLVYSNECYKIYKNIK